MKSEKYQGNPVMGNGGNETARRGLKLRFTLEVEELKNNFLKVCSLHTYSPKAAATTPYTTQKITSNQ